MLVLALLPAACDRPPESYPPPGQRGPAAAAEGADAKMFVAMNDPYAESYIVKDVRGLEAGEWRWTGPEPTLHFVLETAENLLFRMEFSIAGATFKTTGPVTITFRVNGHELATEQYDSFGRKQFEKPVPAEWIEAGGDTIVSATIEPPWISPNNTKLGVILSRAGFVTE